MIARLRRGSGAAADELVLTETGRGEVRLDAGAGAAAPLRLRLAGVELLARLEGLWCSIWDRGVKIYL